MIDYQRTEWYGWGYLWQHLGASVLPKTFPVMLWAGAIGGWAASPYGLANHERFDTARALFGETYGVQVFGIVFGYLCIARLNICYARYWEGVTHCKRVPRHASQLAKPAPRARASSRAGGQTVSPQFAETVPTRISPVQDDALQVVGRGGSGGRLRPCAQPRVQP
jgi:hypothetical protein